MEKKSLILGCSAALGSEALYGLSYIFTKTATNDATPLALLGWRFLVAFLVMSALILTKVIHVNFSGKKLMPVLLISLFDPVLYFIGETFGISHTSASESGVFLACIPVAALIASTVMLHKRPSRQQVIGILITLIGVLITVLASNATTSLSIIGYLFLLLAVCSYALYTVFVEKAVDFTGIEATYMMLIAGALVFVTLALTEAKLNHSLTSLITLPMTDTAFLTAVLYQAIGSSVLALFLSNYAIAKVGVNRAASFIGISTVVSIIAGVLFLGEHFGGYQIIGAVIIITGVYLANMIIKI
ncbi:putative membrane protein [Lentilactobacillus parafarraginis F0439]|uniref:Putative membrane protein n=1 Tax=Lentilactobacillus parafarraginis F0439 TaxID=797515 RepID=G9ZRK0_9LACO|nr:DMT family transporter [Lentilactobacillus parafarraginis]EHL96518.1 putative membrane protein [Lentilactobacillus parafarraginis F0439]